MNEDELFALTDWCGVQGFDLTFIELTPMGAGLGAERFWPLSDLRARLKSRYRLVETTETSGGPARYLRVEGSGQKTGGHGFDTLTRGGAIAWRMSHTGG